MEKDTPIQRKLLRVILMTCGAVLTLTCAAFFIYEFITYRDIAKNELETIGKITAANSTASLAFDDKKAADEILNVLKVQRHVVAACLYDKNGKIFSVYPENLASSFFPSQLKNGYSFTGDYLEGFEKVVEGDQHLGTLFLRSDMKAVYNRFSLYGIVAIIFMIISFVFAYLLSKHLQKAISQPILELADTASIISDKKDYSVRAVKKSNDEIGILTEAFNQMLIQIEMQNAEIKALNANLEEKVLIRTKELQGANDILKQQNDLIKTIIDSSIDLIAVVNKDLEYVVINKQADSIYEVKRDELIGKKILDVFPKLKGTTWIELLKKSFDGEFLHQDAYKSFTNRYFENFFIPLKDKDGNTDRVMVIGHDITGIMKANEKLKDVNTALEKSNRDLEQFAYVASHDLQEPLRKIQTFAELSQKNTQHPEIVNRYLQKIQSSAKRMTDLIKAVLNYSRLSKVDSELERVDLNIVVNNIKTDLELLIEEKEAIIKVSSLPVIRGIPLQMTQLFLNLISNSLKFSKEKPIIQIEASLKNGNDIRKELLLEKDESYLEIIFSDNGIGFDQQYAEQIFSIFQRLHNSGDYSGTGIGLALCKKIVENHDGAITVESEQNVGTRFFIYLPSKNLIQLTGQASSPTTKQLK